jgi:Ser-tRNA(Ala) deacylase AlaX
MSTSQEPRMHSAEHLLNQAMVRKFNCNRCFSAHINKKKSKCDYKFDHALEDSDIMELETEINNVISENCDVREEFVTLEEAAEKYNLVRLPEGVENVRIVHIGDFDSCPCIGEHVANTSEIGKIKITSHEYKDGILRIRYKLSAPE